MRDCWRVLLLTGALLAAGAGGGAAQKPPSHASAEQRDIGRVETGVRKYDSALGVVTRLIRPLGAQSECYGICFFPSSSRAVAWRCAPDQSCELHCAVNPPVGGCQ
jgi:hypothetical protein